MKRKVVNILVLVLILTMAFPVAAFAGSVYNMNFTVSGLNGKSANTEVRYLNGELSVLDALAEAGLKMYTDKNSGAASVFSGSPLSADLIAGIQAYMEHKADEKSTAWSDFLSQHSTISFTSKVANPANFAENVKDGSLKLNDLTVGTTYDLSYSGYTATFRLAKAGSGGSTGGGAGQTNPTLNVDPAATSFVDVKSDDYFCTPVLWAAENSITAGIDAAHFGPNLFCTRAQMVTFLWRASGSPDPEGSVCAFTDVKQNDYFYKAILWAVEKEITNGTSATTFGSGDLCTRGQMVMFLYRYEGGAGASAENIFTDVKNTSYYYDAVLWAVENGITKGTSKNTFSPNANCTRGQIVTFLYRDIVK